MDATNLGNQLYNIIGDAQNALFTQGELARLSYGAFDIAATSVQNSSEENITIEYPIGYGADKSPILNRKEYGKKQLLARYEFLAVHQLALNGLVQLVTIMEAMIGDITRAIVLRYPQKLSNKRSIKLQTVLQSSSIEEVHFRATDSLINELAYKSPRDFADAFENLTSINLLECPAFHKYAEAKATRDIHIHNRGVANEVYEKKAGSHARARSGTQLPVDTAYFLESYEACIQVTEWLESKLHERWHSSDLEENQRKQMEMNLGSGSN